MPQLADAVTMHADVYKSGDWQPRYLALLAQAASGEGDQEEAIALCDLGKVSSPKATISPLPGSSPWRAPVSCPRPSLRRTSLPGFSPKARLAPGRPLRGALALVG